MNFNFLSKSATLFMMAIAGLEANTNSYACNNNASRYECQQISCFENPCDMMAENPLFIGGSLLYWKSQAAGIDVQFGSATFNRFVDTSEVTQTITAETDRDPKFKWNVGYRLTAGYRFDCSESEVSISWTHFKGDGKGCASDKWKVELEQFDAIYAYNTKFGCALTFTPFLGIRAAYIKQNLNTTALITLFVTEGSALDTKIFDDSQKFNGIGPMFGVNGTYDLGCGFSCYGTIGGSVLYGTHKLTFNDQEIVTPLFPSFTSSTVDRKTSAFDCNLDLMFGFEWKCAISETSELTLRAGSEHHHYFDQSRLGVTTGDLSFDGVSFSAEFEF